MPEEFKNHMEMRDNGTCSHYINLTCQIRAEGCVLGVMRGYDPDLDKILGLIEEARRLIKRGKVI